MIKAILDFISEKTKENQQYKFALGIATTSYDFEEPYFSFPRRIENWGFYFHIVFSNSDDASHAISKLKEYFNEFLIDAEDKRDDFSFSYIENLHKEIKFKKIYPNNITVSSTLDLIDKYSKKNIVIFGHGNLAFELANNLRSRNINYCWIPSRVSSSIKYKKMVNTHKDYKLDLQDISSHIFINCCPYESDLLNRLTSNNDQIKIDVTGKNPFKKAIKNKVHLVDISSRLSHEILYLCLPNIYKNNFGSKNINNETLISGGYPGSEGDIIVDSILKPSYIIGISDGAGGMKQRINKPYKFVNNYGNEISKRE